jgi:hypothetical protein
MSIKFKDFFINEELLQEEGELNYNASLEGETFKVVVDVNKNPSKKGIKVKFFPTNGDGMVLQDLTPEEVDTMTNSIATSISKKFNEFGLEFDRDTDAPDKMAANFQIPLDSIFTFIRTKVLGGDGEKPSAPEEETQPTNDEENT